jgi:hypothetical protein
MSCRSVLSITKSFKKPLVSSISTLKIRTISTLLIDNIVENHHLIVEMNTRTTLEMIIQIIDQMKISINEMNFEMNFEKETIMINLNQIVVRKDVLYVRNLIVDQSIIRKTSATLEKALFRSIFSIQRY